jgi:hypothetical protein
MKMPLLAATKPQKKKTVIMVISGPIGEPVLVSVMSVFPAVKLAAATLCLYGLTESCSQWDVQSVQGSTLPSTTSCSGNGRIYSLTFDFWQAAFSR